MNSLESSDMAKNLVASYASNSMEHRSSSGDGFGSNPKQEKSGGSDYGSNKYNFPAPVIPQLRQSTSKKSSNAPAMCVTCGLKTELHSMRYKYNEIQLATDNFSSDNLLGGEYGPVYLGRLTDGQRIAAKVQRGASATGSAESHSEVYVLNFARHKNIVMLLGYCCNEDQTILVYEYICNKSLNWHLFENTEHVLEWHRRYTIAIGIAKGLRFLHEECRGSPIIHPDVRPGNILLTHDFVPMLGDFGLAKWKTNEDDLQTRVLGSHGYLAPEYVENGTVSVRTDVYAFGIVLIQLISGRRPMDSDSDGQQVPLRQWALPLIETLALQELADRRLGDSSNTGELYHMARTAYACIQTEPEMRPSMAELKAEYKPPATLFPNIWQDCWIIRAPSADGCSGRYVVAASAGNAVHSGFCSWDFYTKKIHAYHFEDDSETNHLGDFRLAKWKTNKDDIQTRVLGSHGHLAPEYVENVTVSVRTDVYAFGIVLIQLISGRRPMDSDSDGQQVPLRQWALPLIETLALQELADRRLGDSSNTGELYHMARTAYACIQTCDTRTLQNGRRTRVDTTRHGTRHGSRV